MKTRFVLFALFFGLLIGSAAAITPPQKTLFFIGAGSGPVIDCDFKSAGAQVAGSLTAPSLCPTSTFTRSSTAYGYSSSSGTLTSYGLNVPRVPVYNPDNGANLGLRIEEQRTNKNNNFNANPTDLTNVTKSGDAAATLTLVDDSAALAAAGLSSIASGGKVYKLDNSAGTTNSFAAVGGQTGNLNAHSISAYTRTNGSVCALRINGANQVQYTNTAYVRQKYENFIPANTGQQLAFDAPGGSICYFILNQLEEGAFATTPIVVSGASATRASEVAGFSVGATKLGANPNEMTLIVRGRTGGGFNSNIDSPMFYLSDGSSSNAVYLVWNTIGALRLIVKSGASFQVLVNVATGVAPGTDFTLWLAMAPNNFSWQLIGQTKQTQASGTLPVNLSSFKIGTPYDNASFWNGTISRIIVYKTRLSDTQAASIATSLSTASLDPANDNELVKLAQGY